MRRAQFLHQRWKPRLQKPLVHLARALPLVIFHLDCRASASVGALILFRRLEGLLLFKLLRGFDQSSALSSSIANLIQVSCRERTNRGILVWLRVVQAVHNAQRADDTLWDRLAC